MAKPGVPESQLKKVGGFPAGVNNVAPDSDLPRDEKGNITALRKAVNVDLVGPSKKPRMRAGTTQKLDGACHSPATLRGGRHLFLVRNGDLGAWTREQIDAGSGSTMIRAAVGTRYLHYAEVNGDVYWSNTDVFRRIRGADLADLPGWIDCPGVPQVSAYDGVGGLNPGTYRIGVTWFDADAYQSGCAGLAEVTLIAGQGILVNRFPVPPEGAVRMRLYRTEADGEVLYACSDMLPGVTQIILGAEDLGAQLETLWHTPMPPVALLRYWSGRLLGFEQDNVLRWSEALRVGLTTPDNYMRLGARGTLLEPIGEGSEGAGCWVADHARTYWMAGNKPSEWRRVIKRDHAAVFGTSIVVPGNVLGLETTEPVAYWLGSDGVFCAGLPGGELRPLTEGRLALPEGEIGASVFREYEGLRQIVTSFLSRSNNALAIGDRVSASVTKYSQ